MSTISAMQFNRLRTLSITIRYRDTFDKKKGSDGLYTLVIICR